MIYNEIDNATIQSFEYETTMISDSNIIGTCELGKATIQLLNDSNKYSIYKDSWIKTVHGSFYIYNVEPVQEKVSIKLSCYDIKYKLDTPYDSSKHSFPCTLKEWRNSIFNDCNVEYDDSDFPNSNLILNSEPYIEKNSSNRTVIKMIAQAGASAVTTDSNDKFYFTWFEDTIHIVDDWIELTTEKQSTTPINLVVLGRGDTEDNVYYPEEKPINQVEFRIDNNYILDPQNTSSSEDLRYSTIIPIYEQVNNFSYLVFKIRSQQISNKLSIKLGQKIKYVDIWNNELTAYVMTKKINWLGGNLNDDDNYEITLSADKISESSTELKYASNVKNDVMRVERKADKNSGIIEDIIQETSEQNKKITQLSLSLEEIKGEISDIADVTITSEGNGSITAENINESEPIFVKVHATSNENYSFLYPGLTLYPSANTFTKSRTLLFKNSNGYSTSYEIPNDLLYLDENTYDEFVLDYEEQKCYIVHRVEINENNENYKLTAETTEYFDYPEITLQEGDYTISTPSSKNTYIYVRLMTKNMYTSQYTTKIEMKSALSIQTGNITSEVSKTYITKADSTTNINSAKTEAINSSNASTDNKLKNYSTTIQMNNIIEQKITDSENSINIEVAKKVNNVDYTHATIVAKINDDTSSALIDADKIDLKANDIINIIAGNTINLTTKNIVIDSTNLKVDKNGNLKAVNGEFSGKIISTNGSIGGWLINNSGLTNGTVKINSDGSSTIYTVADLIIIRGYILNLTGFELPSQMIKHYDLNGDGVVTAADYVLLQNLIGIAMS